MYHDHEVTWKEELIWTFTDHGHHVIAAKDSHEETIDPQLDTPEANAARNIVCYYPRHFAWKTCTNHPLAFLLRIWRSTRFGVFIFLGCLLYEVSYLTMRRAKKLGTYLQLSKQQNHLQPPRKNALTRFESSSAESIPANHMYNTMRSC